MSLKYSPRNRRVVGKFDPRVRTHIPRGGCAVVFAVTPLQGSGLRIMGSGFRVQGSGIRVLGSGFWVKDSGCRVQGAGRKAQGAGFSQEKVYAVLPPI